MGVVLAIVAALLTPLLPPHASPVAAQANADVLPPPTFRQSPEGGRIVQLADRPAPVAFLGYGEQGVAYVTESAIGTTANAVGFDAAVASPEVFAGTSPYVRSGPLGHEVLASSVNQLGGDQGRASSVVIHRSGDTAPWVASFVHDQQVGFGSTVATWSFDQPGGASAFGMPGEPVGVALLDAAPLPLVVFATTAGIFVYRVDPDGPGVALVRSEAVGGAILTHPPVALEHDRGYDSLGVVRHDPRDRTRFVVATASPAGGGQDQLQDLLLLQVSGDTLSRVMGLVATPSTQVRWTTGEPVQVRYSVPAGTPPSIVDGTPRGMHVAVQAGDRWHRFLGIIGVPSSFGYVAGYPCDTSTLASGQRPGFDFAVIGYTAASVFGIPTGWNASSFWSGTCAAPTPDGGLRLQGTYGIGADGQSYTYAVDRSIPAPGDGHHYTEPQLLLTLPCSEALTIAGEPSLTSTAAVTSCAGLLDPDGTYRPGNLFRTFGVSVLAGVDADPNAGRHAAERTALIGASPFALDPTLSLPDAGAILPIVLLLDALEGDPASWTGWDQFWALELPTDDGVVRHLDRLPSTPVRLKVELENDDCIAPDTSRCNPRIRLGDPVPVAVLMSPPYVAGAGQEPAGAPTFAQSRTVGGSTDTVSAARVGASLGVDFSDPTGMHGVTFEVTYQREVEETVSTSSETTQTQAFVGLPDDDTIVYNATSMWTLDGVIVESSTGLGIGTTTEIRHPRSNTLASSSVELLYDQFPETFGPGTPVGEGLRAILAHEPGDPGSYLSYHAADGPGAQVDEVCIGSIDGTEPVDVPLKSGVAPNPFQQDPAPIPPDNAVLVSPAFQVLAGTANSEGASIELSSGASQSYLGTHSIDASITGKAFYVTAGVSGGGTWGSGWTYSVSEGTSFEGYVGHIPYRALQDETYEWRMYLCKQNLGGRIGLEETLPVWVLGYTVDGYQGSGGLQLGDLEALAPIRSELASRSTPLTWSLDSGTIARFAWELEAVGAPDRRIGELTYPSIDTYRAEFPPGEAHTFAADVGEQLLPGQLYRWRVTATDFFGNTTGSAYEYFVTAGPPDNTFSWTPLAPVVGDTVTLMASEPESPATSYAWTAGSSELVDARQVTFVVDQPGLLPVTLRVETPEGAAERTQQVAVRVAADDGAFATRRDTRLDVAAPGVLANAPGADRAELAGAALNGTVRLSATGAFNYSPDPGFCGADAFAYRAFGGGLEADRPGTVAITVVCDPQAVDDRFVGERDQPLVVAAPGVLANDTAPGSAAMTAELLAGPTAGELTLAPDGSFTYVPEAGFCGVDRFSYRARVPDAVLEPVSGDIGEVLLDIRCSASPVDDLLRDLLEDIVDVSPGDTHADSVALMFWSDIATGFPDGTFRPNLPISRGQLASFLARALDLRAEGPLPYTDVGQSSAHADAIVAVTEAGIASGFDDGTFRPLEPVTRAQMASFLARALDLTSTNPADHPDVPAIGVHADAIAAVSEAGIALGFPDGTYRPGGLVTRGQMASFLARALDLRGRVEAELSR